MKKPILLFAASLTFSSLVLADCETSSVPTAPAIPTGKTASFDEMFSAQTSVNAYVSQATAHLPCINNSRRYNAVVNRIHKVAKLYNTELRVYKARQSQTLLTVSSN